MSTKEGARVAVASLVCLALAGSAASEPVSPRGHLVVIGGGTRPASVMALFACLAGGRAGKVLAFPQASERAEAGDEIARELRALGIGQVTIVAVDRAGADAEDTLALTDGVTGLYFGGGDQARLMAVLRGTRLEARLRAAYQDGAAVGGSSAGAAVMSRVMITGDERRPLSKDESWQTIEADNVETADGLGFLDDVILDQHFVRRRRHNRMISLLLEDPRRLGVAIDEETAVWVRPDRTFEVVGNGPVLVFDAGRARTSRDEAGPGLRGAGLELHVLRAGAQYDLSTRTVLRLAADGGSSAATTPAMPCAAR